MGVIRKELVDLLKKFKAQPEVRAVYDKLGRYQKAIMTEVPRAKNYDINFIGMIHGGYADEINLQAVRSQGIVIKALESLNPDIVGVESFCGDNFTVTKMVEQVWKNIGNGNSSMTPENFEVYRADIEDNPENNSVPFYQKLRPDVRFCGVEDFDLMSLTSWLITITEQFKRNNNHTKGGDLYQLDEEVTVLRSFIMIAKMARAMKNTPNARVAIPTGVCHLDEIVQMKLHLRADWTIIDATTLGLTAQDLAPS